MTRAAILLAVVSLLEGCAAVEPHLVPTPAVLKDPRLHFESVLTPDLRSTRVGIFYATTRAPTEGPGHYSDAADDGMTLGLAHVRLGEAGWSWEDLKASHLASTVEKPRNGAVEALDVFGRASGDDSLGDADRRFIAAIDAQLARVRNRQLVLYVHAIA